MLDRCRMALAEVGVDPEHAQPSTRSQMQVQFSPGLSTETMWLLRCVMNGDAGLTCLPCETAARARWSELWPLDGVELADRVFTSMVRACRVDRPFQRQSCGVTS